MSGHNKWQQIRRKKEITDKKRGQMFSKLLRSISVAAKDDPNPFYNPHLKAAIEKAEKMNVPRENIDHAIKRSSEVKNIESLLMGAYGPGGVALLIEAQTDNRNRTIAEIKKILHDHDAKWTDAGSVIWVFEKSADCYEPKFPQKISAGAENKLLILMEALDNHDDVTEIYTNDQSNQ